MSIGNLIVYNNTNALINTNAVLSFGIDKIDSQRNYSDLPTTWKLDTQIYDDYKIYNTLYRYNIQDGSNISLSNLTIQSGYTFRDE